MSDPARQRPRFSTTLRWLASCVCGGVSAGAVLAFVVANMVLMFTSLSATVRAGEPPPRVESYRYEIFGAVVAAGDNRSGADVQAEFSRWQSFHVGGSLLLAAVVGLLVGGLVFFLWRPILETRRFESEGEG